MKSTRGENGRKQGKMRRSQKTNKKGNKTKILEMSGKEIVQSRKKGGHKIGETKEGRKEEKKNSKKN